ncbi:MAG: branched-chain amino acid ABC transporter permease [Promethearchaeota archaeon]|nr:MAG: branched-chain amino acid ABC transporter permease [Candidatus Lokiarchaeota archaeon]
MKTRINAKVKEFPKYFKDWVKTFKGGLTVFCVIGLFLMPLVTTSPYFLGIFMLAMIYSIFAASWDLLAGFVGKISFGQAIFFGLSGYIAGALLKFQNSPWWVAMIIGIGFSALIGLIIGGITLRLKGPYLALGTLVISIILQKLFALYQLKPILGGDEGLSGIPAISSSAVINYYIILVIMIISLILMIQITKTNLGTIFKSIRDDETGADASGINTVKYKIIAFVISGCFAGVAGGLFVMYNRAINPLVFQPLYSFYALVMAALGGIATISGSALGAFIFVFLGEFVRDLTDPLFVFSIILIIIIRFASEGILKSALERLKSFWDILIGR